MRSENDWDIAVPSQFRAINSDDDPMINLLRPREPNVAVVLLTAPVGLCPSEPTVPVRVALMDFSTGDTRHILGFTLVKQFQAAICGIL